MGSAMVPLDRALLSCYRPFISLRYLQRFGRNLRVYCYDSCKRFDVNMGFKQ